VPSDYSAAFAMELIGQPSMSDQTAQLEQELLGAPTPVMQQYLQHFSESALAFLKGLASAIEVWDTYVSDVIQPATGLALALMAGYSLTAPWLFVSILLYLFVGCCWVPVVWLQIRLKHLAATAARAGTTLPPAYHRYYRWWFRLGWPAFVGVLAIFFLMVAKPS
jgi:ABC-type uncharacterized transport system fused permease/ATPase subunit